jgi:RNA recognition motif-containing protein
MSGAERLTLDGKTVLFFSVAKGTTEIYQFPDGRCVRRKDKNTLPETVKRIEFDRQEIKSREFDRAFVDGATVNDLDVQFIQTLADRFLRGLSVERKAMNTEDLNTHQREVSALRNAEILIEIRTNPQALAYARQRRISKASVPRFRVQVPKSPQAAEEANLTVFVSNLPFLVSSQEVQRHFETCGRVRLVSLPTVKPPQREYRFGFVTFYEPEGCPKSN